MESKDNKGVKGGTLISSEKMQELYAKYKAMLHDPVLLSTELPNIPADELAFVIRQHGKSVYSNQTYDMLMGTPGARIWVDADNGEIHAFMSISYLGKVDPTSTIWSQIASDMAPEKFAELYSAPRIDYSHVNSMLGILPVPTVTYSLFLQIMVLWFLPCADLERLISEFIAFILTKSGTVETDPGPDSSVVDLSYGNKWYRYPIGRVLDGNDFNYFGNSTRAMIVGSAIKQCKDHKAINMLRQRISDNYYYIDEEFRYFIVRVVSCGWVRFASQLHVSQFPRLMGIISSTRNNGTLLSAYNGRGTRKTPFDNYFCKHFATLIREVFPIELLNTIEWRRISSVYTGITVGEGGMQSTALNTAEEILKSEEAVTIGKNYVDVVLRRTFEDKHTIAYLQGVAKDSFRGIFVGMLDSLKSMYNSIEQKIREAFEWAEDKLGPFLLFLATSMLLVGAIAIGIKMQLPFQWIVLACVLIVGTSSLAILALMPQSPAVTQGEGRNENLIQLISTAFILAFQKEPLSMKALSDSLRTSSYSKGLLSFISEELSSVCKWLGYNVFDLEEFAPSTLENDVQDLVSQVNELIQDRDINSRIATDRLLAQRVDGLWKQSLALREQVYHNMSFTTTQKGLFSRICSELKVMHSYVLRSSDLVHNRVEPLCVWVFGYPDQGKSTWLPLPVYGAYTYLKRKHPKVFDKPVNKDLIFTKVLDSDYWEGYYGQFAVELPELFQILEPGRTNIASHCALFHSLMEGNSMPLNYATLEEKGKHFMTSNIVLTTSNNTDIHTFPVYSKESIARRVHLPIQLTRKVDKHGNKVVWDKQLSTIDDAWEAVICNEVRVFRDGSEPICRDNLIYTGIPERFREFVSKFGHDKPIPMTTLLRLIAEEVEARIFNIPFTSKATVDSEWNCVFGEGRTKFWPEKTFRGMVEDKAGPYEIWSIINNELQVKRISEADHAMFAHMPFRHIGIDNCPVPTDAVKCFLDDPSTWSFVKCGTGLPVKTHEGVKWIDINLVDGMLSDGKIKQVLDLWIANHVIGQELYEHADTGFKNLKGLFCNGSAEVDCILEAEATIEVVHSVKRICLKQSFSQTFKDKLDRLGQLLWNNKYVVGMICVTALVAVAVGIYCAFGVKEDEISGESASYFKAKSHKAVVSRTNVHPTKAQFIAKLNKAQTFGEGSNSLPKLATQICNNVIVLEYEWPDGTSYKGIGTVIENDTVLVASHMIDLTQPPRIVRVYDSTGTSQYQSCMFAETCPRKVPGTNDSFLLSPKMQYRKKMSRSLLKQSENPTRLHRVNFVLDEDTATYHALMTSGTSVAPLRKHKIVWAWAKGNNEVKVDQGWWSIDHPGGSGYCGLPVIGDCNGRSVLAGVHCSSNGHDSIVTPLYQEQLQWYRDQKSHDEAYYGRLVPQLDMAKPMGIEIDGTQRRAVPGISLGECNKHSYVSDKNSLNPTIFMAHDAGHKGHLEDTFPVNWVPAHLRRFTNSAGKIIDPDQVNFEKMEQYNTPPVDAAVWRVATENIDYVMRGFDPFRGKYPTPKRLSLEEAIFGTEFPECKISSYQGSDACGVPGCFEGKHKSDYFTLEPKFISQDIRQQVDYIATRASRGKVVPMVNKVARKEECREKSKVDQGKTRWFYVGSLAHNIFIKQELGMLYAMIKDKWPLSSAAIGVNPHSHGWKRIYEVISGFPNVVAGDINGNDLSIPAWAWIPFFLWANKFYKYQKGSDSYLRLACACFMITSCYALLGTLIWMFVSGHPSGHIMTTFFNSWFAFFALALIFIVLRKSTKYHFYDHVMVKVFGDDNASSVDDEVKEWYNMKTIANGFKLLFGMIYTTPSKEVNMPEFMKLEEVEFLSRTFTVVNGQVLAPLREDSILKSVNFTRDKSYDELLESIRLAAMEFYHHGREKFDWFRTRATERLALYDLPWTGETFEYWQKRHAFGYAGVLHVTSDALYL